MRFVFYELVAGKVQYVVDSQEVDYLTLYPIPAGLGGVQTDIDIETQYIDVVNEIAISRPTFSITHPATVVNDLVAEAVFTGIPSGTSVTWPDGVVTVETDGQIEWSTDTVGFYTFKFELFPYQIKEIIIEAITNP